MAANTTPIFPLTINTTPGVALTAANTAYDGTGTVGTIYTAGVNGGIPNVITFSAAGTNVATVASVFINNGSTNATATNNSHICDVALPATTASNTAAIPTVTQSLLTYLPNGIPAGYKIMVALRTAVAAGYAITCDGMDY